MKNTIKLILPILLLLFACKTKTEQTVHFKVWGNCEMCKETIETALKLDGIRQADWNVNSKIIELIYDSTKIKIDDIQKNIAAVGYDNDKYKGNDSAYAQLPECCQYTRKP